MKSKRSYYLLYTALFWIFASMILYFYYSQGRTMIDYNGDGFRQHFRALLYYSDYLKTIIHNLFSGHLIIPQWDFAIGEGNDIIQTFHYYCLGDLFTFFSFLFPREKMYLYYDLSALFRMYASGIAFGWLCFQKKKDDLPAILSGSMLYAYSEYALFAVSAHVFFISAAFFLPLIILGVEKIMDGEKPYLFSIAVALSCLSNIYFFYMNVLSTVFYVAVRILVMHRSIRESIGILGKLLLYSVIGLLMSSVITLPMLEIILSGSRLNSEIISPVLYTSLEYIRMYSGYVFDGYNFFGGFSILGLLATFYLLAERKNRTLIFLWLMGIVFSCLPWIGKLYNALIYPTTRWMYALSLLMSYIIVDHFEEIRDGRKGFACLLLITVGYYCSALFFNREIWQVYVLYLAGSLFTILFCRFVKQVNLKRVMITMVALFCVFFEIVFRYSPRWWDMTSTGATIEEVNEIQKDEHYLFDEREDDFYRYSGDHMQTNQSIHGKRSSTQYYWSIANANVIEYRRYLGLLDHNNHHYDHYDDRFSLNTLAGVRYFIESDKGFIPYGYELADTVKGYRIYESEYSLPLLFVYDSYLITDEWKDLKLEERQEALLQTAVVDEALEGFIHEQINSSAYDLKTEISETDGVELEEHLIRVINEKGSLVLKAQNQDEGEYYLIVEGLYSDTDANLSIYHGDMRKSLYYKGPYHFAYPDKHEFVVNLGYMESFDGEVRIQFPSIGEYTYENIRIACQPLDQQIDELKKRKEMKINDLTVRTNEVSADISLNENEIVCLSIPYSKGWKAFVDDKETELFRCGVAYSGIIVEKGQHSLELSYSTPYLKVGALISLLSLGLLLFLCFLRKGYNK